MRLEKLKRYSKPRGAGDQTSGGRGKLLRATTGLSRMELVVRETLQNSWDARDDEWIPAYGVRVYRMDDHVRELLRQNVFTDLPESMYDLVESLNDPDLHAVEIFDRGTSGLDGPFRASEVTPDGGPNNFNSFVFDIGTTKASSTSGGTYGFGKTATFEVSRAHSVVYWSRCRTSDGHVEHRLIACALHDPFDQDGARYTGAHWWGDPFDEEIVPLRGTRAEALGDALFRTRFGRDADGDQELGTSIMIIDPVISVSAGEDAARERTPIRTDEHADLLAQQVTAALSISAWPKTIPMDGATAPMFIQLHRNRFRRDVATEVRDHHEFFSHALMHVRQVQGQLEQDIQFEAPENVIREKTFPITLLPKNTSPDKKWEMFGGRTDRTVGHLHMMASLKDPGLDTPTRHDNSVCLMRSEAELVVRYENILDLDDERVLWHGVFKPTPECDRHFSAAEPPTHDNWNPASAEDEGSQYVVDKALRQLRSKARAFLQEHRVPETTGQRSVRTVAESLQSFVPFGELPLDDSRPPRTQGRSRSKSNRATDEVQITAARPLPDGGGQILSLQAQSAEHDQVRVSATVYAMTAEGRLVLEDSELTATWCVDGSPISHGLVASLSHGTRVELELRTRVATALDIEVKAVAAE